MVRVVLLLVAMQTSPVIAVCADGSIPGVNLVAADIDQELNVSLAASWAATLLPGAAVADPFLSGVDKQVASGLLVYVMMLLLPGRVSARLARAEFGVEHKGAVVCRPPARHAVGRPDMRPPRQEHVYV